MKMKFTFSVLSLLIAVWFSPVVAQSGAGKANTLDDQVAKFTMKWEDAFNRADAKALVNMFTSDGTRVHTDGSVISGTDQLEEFYAKRFETNPSFRLKLRAESNTLQADGTIVATGSYKSVGTDESGNPVTYTGTYRNELVKGAKHLQIIRMTLFDALN